MAVDFDSDVLAELSFFWGLGVDGVFVDCASTAAEWLAAVGAGSAAADESWLGSVVSGPGDPQEGPMLQSRAGLVGCARWPLQCFSHK